MLLHYPCTEDALAEIASEKAAAVWALVRSMPRVWRRRWPKSTSGRTGLPYSFETDASALDRNGKRGAYERSARAVNA